MYLTTLSKHPHINSNQLMIIVYKIHYLIQSRSMTCASLCKSTMSSLVDPMTKDNLCDAPNLANGVKRGCLFFFFL